MGYKVTGSTERRKGRKSTTATTEENVPIFEELVSSQKDEPDTLNSIRQTTSRISINKSSVHCLFKKKNPPYYKRLKTPNSACLKRRVERAGKLLQRCSIFRND